MKHLCPYCQGDMSNAYKAIKIIAATVDHHSEGAITLCVHCGEPIVFDPARRGFRLPEWAEMQEYVHNPSHIASRRGFIELERRRKTGEPLPVECDWQNYLDAFELRRSVPVEVQNTMKTVYFIAFSRALRMVEEVTRHMEPEQADGVLSLAKAELNAFYEGIAKKDKDEQPTRQRHGNVAG